MSRNISIYDPKSGEETFITEAAFNSLLESGVIIETGAFAPDDHIKELSLSLWDLVREATRER